MTLWRWNGFRITGSVRGFLSQTVSNAGIQWLLCCLNQQAFELTVEWFQMPRRSCDVTLMIISPVDSLKWVSQLLLKVEHVVVLLLRLFHKEMEQCHAGFVGARLHQLQQGPHFESHGLACVASLQHYSDVIMGATVSQITGLSIVYSTVCTRGNIKAQCYWPLFTGDRWIPLTKGL